MSARPETIAPVFNETGSGTEAMMEESGYKRTIETFTVLRRYDHDFLVAVRHVPHGAARLGDDVHPARQPTPCYVFEGGGTTDQAINHTCIFNVQADV